MSRARRAVVVLLALVPCGARAEPATGGPLPRAIRALRTGRYAEVAKLAAGARGADRDRAELAVAQAEIATGHGDAARRRLEALVTRAPKLVEARVALGELDERQGRKEDADKIWNQFFDEYEGGRIDKKSARELTAVAIAARGLGSWQDASDLLRDAVDDDERYLPAHLEWARTFLSKYAAGEAERDVRAALTLDPDDPDAHALMARIALTQSYDVPVANREIARALRTNPYHAEAIALRAEIALDVDDLADAQADCDAILDVNPEDERAHALSAAIALLGEDRKRFESHRRQVLARNPRASGFFRDVAEVLVKQHRYEEANQLEAEALAVDPKDALALAEIGQNWLRLGDEQKGHAALQQAFALDRYNVRTFNLLSLYDEVIPDAYTLVDGKPFRLRLAKKERPVLEPLVSSMLQTEWRELCARYGFTPTVPVQVELYADPQHYAVRTVGLPSLEALGVTFGRVVTARSPSRGEFNWGMMLWHEVAHVFSIQLSRSRVPRWFTEGLAEYETALHDPDWRRHTQPELHAALARGKLLPVAELNRGFVRARTVSEIVVAYHEAAEAVSFLIRRWGFPAAVTALRRFGEGKQVPDVIREVTGLAIADFDRAFQDDLRHRLAAYDGQLVVRPSEYADLDAAAEDREAHPDDARAQAMYALSLLAHGRSDEAGKAATQAMQLGSRSPEACYAAAMVLARKEDFAGAELLLRRVIELGGDGRDVRLQLARLALKRKQSDVALVELERAAQLDPEDAVVREELAGLYTERHRDEDALAATEAAAHLDNHDAQLVRDLVLRYAKLRRWAKVREWAARMRWIDPYDSDVTVAAARAALEDGHAKEAAALVEPLLAIGPEHAAPLKAVLARALVAVGDRKRAHTLAAEALAEDPHNADAHLVP